jgi:hypothetical protein
MSDSQSTGAARRSEVVDESGPWPFVTRRVYRLTDESRSIWSSRHHRKGLLIRSVIQSEELAADILHCLWCPSQLNWWIATVFAVGSVLFAFASVLCLWPTLATEWTLTSLQVNAIFFAGSIPFTTAAYLQLFQAANAGEFSADDTDVPKRLVLFGWRPNDAGWLSSALQFVGTILFNFNTFDAMIPSLTWFQEDLAIWVPN